MTLKWKIWLWLALAVGVVLGVDLLMSYRQLEEDLRLETENNARIVYGFMMATRRIYQQQFVASGLAVNDRTIGFLPAHSLSRIARDFANWNDSGVIFNNVSDVPRNPGNRADRDELAAMEWFRANPEVKDRMTRVVDAQGRGYLLFVAPIWVEPFCLRCHGEPEAAPPSIRDKYSNAYGYQIGDLRGLVSIRIPLERFDARFRELWGMRLAKSLAGYALLFLAIGLLIDILVVARLTRLQTGAARIADGDYGSPLLVQGDDEICRLARGINRMSEEVCRREEALKQAAEENRRAAARIDHLEYYDMLTGLPNRALLTDRLGLALAVAHRQKHVDALILFNLDRFKILNDAHGNELGDLLLVAVGGRLASLLREGDTLARLAGDEFAILLQDIGTRREDAGRRALVVVEKIREAMRQPFSLAEGDHTLLTASIGIALSPEGVEDTPLETLRRANTALHRAKEAGGNQAVFFDDAMGDAARRRYSVERELRRAIPAGELRLYLQPQVDAVGALQGAEALVRWQHPERGLLPPGVFVPIAEESDLIVEMGAWVLDAVCRLMARETMAGYPLRLAVNISPRQFRQRDFVPWLKERLAASGADPTQLTIEVTEGLVIDNLDTAVARISELADIGVRFSIDDFGTGYSSLAYLKRLPIHELKIDKSFVQDAPRDPNDAALVETILSVARHLHLQVVAEGVETEAQAAYLDRQGGVIRQGYYYGKPAPAEEWIARWRAA